MTYSRFITMAMSFVPHVNMNYFRFVTMAMSTVHHVNMIPKIGGMPIGASLALDGLPLANIRSSQS